MENNLFEDRKTWHYFPPFPVRAKWYLVKFAHFNIFFKSLSVKNEYYLNERKVLLCLPPLKGEIYCFRAVRRRLSSSSVTKVCARNSSFIIHRNLKLFCMLAYYHMEQRIFYWQADPAIFGGVIAPFYLENVPKSTFPCISLQLIQLLLWNLK